MIKSVLWQFFGFRGRITRLRYFSYTILVWVLLYLLRLLVVPLVESTPLKSVGGVSIFLVALFVFVGEIVSQTSLAVRRGHDVGFSGLFTGTVWAVLSVLWSFALIFDVTALSQGLLAVGSALWVYLVLRGGDTGPNKFGDDPVIYTEQTAASD